MKAHDEPVPFASDDIDHELIFQSARVDRDERFDDAAVRVRNDEVRKALAGPLDRRESRDEELAPPLCRHDGVAVSVRGRLLLLGGRWGRTLARNEKPCNAGGNRCS